MKAMLVKSLAVALLATSVSTEALALNRQQKDTAVGAVLGGAAGAVVGNDVVSTMAGAALGGVIGSQWNSHKREASQNEQRREHREHRKSERHFQRDERSERRFNAHSDRRERREDRPNRKENAKDRREHFAFR